METRRYSGKETTNYISDRLQSNQLARFLAEALLIPSIGYLDIIVVYTSRTLRRVDDVHAIA